MFFVVAFIKSINYCIFKSINFQIKLLESYIIASSYHFEYDLYKETKFKNFDNLICYYL